MIETDRELLARLSAVNKNLASVNQNMGEVTLRLLATWQNNAELDPTDLRTVANGLVSLAHQLMDLGMDMALRAVDLHQISRGGEDTQDREGSTILHSANGFRSE